MMHDSPKPTTDQTPAPARHEYRVPRRFSLSEGLAILTLFGGLFNLLYFLRAPQGFFLFFGLLGMAVCLMQMRFGEVPRAASMVTGLLVLVVWELITHNLLPAAMVLPISLTHIGFYITAVVFGTTMGYGVGTLAAGVFLASDRFTGKLFSGLERRQSSAGAPAGVETWWDAGGRADARPSYLGSSRNSLEGESHGGKADSDDRG